MTASSTEPVPPSRRAPGSWVALGSGDGGDSPNRTWQDLARDTEVVRRALAGRGATRPLVCCADRYHAAVVLLACWSDGRPAILPPNLRPETLRAIAADAGADLVLHDREIEGVDVRTLLAARPAPDLDLPALLRRLAAALEDKGPSHLVTAYTSGSTGQATPHHKSAGQLLGEADALARAFSIGSRARVLSSAPVHHIYGLLFSLLLPLSVGGMFARDTPLHADTIALLARRLQVNVFCGVPPHLRGLRALERHGMPPFEHTFCSGARLAASDAAMLLERFGIVVTEVLGSTETGGIAWRIAGSPVEWTPLPGVSVASDPDGTVLLSSPFLPADAAQPFRGSDKIQLMPGGGFLHLGRGDGIVKVGGERVSVTEVEHHLLGLPGVRDAAVVAVDGDEARGQELWAAVVSTDLQETDIRRALARSLDGVAIPRRFAFVRALPREESGKLQRLRLLDLFVTKDQTRDQQT